MRMVLLILVALIAIAPAAAWVIYKPVRVLLPEWVRGVSCIDPTICIDDESRYSDAHELYESALHFVTSAAGPFRQNPRVVFCTTEACFQSFGFNRASASAVGKFGIVVSPRGWKDYYLRHEMIHHRQDEELGVFSVLFWPEWLIEGMAYSFSHDPRHTLAERWQHARAEFESWLKEVGTDTMWEEARKL